MKKNISLIAILLGCSFGSLAQTTDQTASELNSTPPVLAPVNTPTVATEANETKVIEGKRKVSYGLSAGTLFSRLYGTSTFLEPSVMFPVTRRFSAFASLSFINTFGANPRYFGSEVNNGGYAPLNNQRYILHAGGNYMVTERLNLTGSVWRDLSKNPMPASLNLYNPGGTSGLMMRANYKLTDNLSVLGGLRVSNGNNPYNNMLYNPGLPFGF